MVFGMGPDSALIRHWDKGTVGNKVDHAEDALNKVVFWRIEALAPLPQSVDAFPTYRGSAGG